MEYVLEGSDREAEEEQEEGVGARSERAFWRHAKELGLCLVAVNDPLDVFAIQMW